MLGDRQRVDNDLTHGSTIDGSQRRQDRGMRGSCEGGEIAD